MSDELLPSAAAASACTVCLESFGVPVGLAPIVAVVVGIAIRLGIDEFRAWRARRQKSDK